MQPEPQGRTERIQVLCSEGNTGLCVFLLPDARSNFSDPLALARPQYSVLTSHKKVYPMDKDHGAALGRRFEPFLIRVVHETQAGTTGQQPSILGSDGP